MSSIIAFPDSLRSSIKKNSGNHLSFEIKDGMDPKQNTKIHLYIPSGFSLGDGANFSNVDLGVISGLERLNNARKNAAEGASQADVVATMGEGQAIGAALMKALSIGNQFNAGQAAQIKTGVTLNPATTLAYDGSALRQFELNFRLIAESAKEAETIRLIEHTFRKAMYAKLEGSIALKYPPLFKIKFMNKILITFLLLSSTSLTFSQIKMEGLVKDSLNNPLELANVILINKETSALESFAISNANGEYKLSLQKNTSYNLQVSYIGMESISRQIDSKDNDINKDFTLSQSNVLDAVELTYEMPVKISGDTLIYNADSFNTGTERKLEDVLKNLPGVEVNEDGQIEVEGKVVGKVMVEGKDFFDGDTKIATKNIPSNAIDKVQILKNYSEVGQLSGVQNNQDNIAINIKLKKGKDKFWFGNVTAGVSAIEGLLNNTSDTDVDNQSLYLFQPKLFYYSPKYTVNVIGDLNNIGELAFTRRDYFNFSGGFSQPSSKSGTSISLGNNNLGFLQLQNNKAKDISSKFGAANFSWSPKKTLDIGGFAIFSNSKNELQENRSVQYTDAPAGFSDEDTESNTSQNNDLGMLKLTTKYQPNASNQLEYEALGNLSKSTRA